MTIYHGDCHEIVPLLGRFDLLLTDPPYGLQMSGGTWGKKMDETYSKWDDAAPAPGVLGSMIMACSQRAVIWGGNYFDLPPRRGWLIWKKPYFPTMADAELAWTSEDMNMRVFESTRTNGESKEHPTQKPVELMTWCLSFFPTAMDILDPYAGGGTTGRACKDLGRKCTMIEREEKYCEIAARRMGQEVLAL